MLPAKMKWKGIKKLKRAFRGSKRNDMFDMTRDMISVKDDLSHYHV